MEHIAVGISREMVNVCSLLFTIYHCLYSQLSCPSTLRPLFPCLCQRNFTGEDLRGLLRAVTHLGWFGWVCWVAWNSRVVFWIPFRQKSTPFVRELKDIVRKIRHEHGGGNGGFTKVVRSLDSNGMTQVWGSRGYEMRVEYIYIYLCCLKLNGLVFEILTKGLHKDTWAIFSRILVRSTLKASG